MPEEFDLGSSMEETYNELEQTGGGASDPTEASSPPAAPPVSSDQPAAAGVAPSQPTAQEAWRSLPKAWRKEMEAHWGKLPPEVMQYAHEREKQALDGITQYKQTADKWSQTVQPFQQWFDHYKIDPHEAFNRLATSHIVLKYGKPEDRAKWAQQLVQDYGLADVLGLQPQKGSQGGSPAPQGNEMLFQMGQRLDAIQKELYDRQLQENIAQVNKFFSDPANEFAADLQDDILKIFEKGQASTLQEAYETAKWLNPSVRQKLLQKETDAATKPPVKGPPNVKSSSVAPAPTETAEESIEETMRATLQRMQSR